MAESIADAIEDFHRATPLSGVVHLTIRGETIFERAFGAASVQLAVPNRTDTKFHIASVTKMFIAAAVLRLVDEGALDLSAHPGRYQGDFRAVDGRVTLHHLLSNTSGLADIYRVTDLRLEMGKFARDGASFTSYLGAMEQAFAPGETWSYSSTGFLMLAYLIEKVRGQPFGVAMREMFLDPLGMANTGEDDPLIINPGRAYGHVTRDGIVAHAEHDKLAGVAAPREFYATAGDLALWCQALLDGRVLSPKAERLSFTSYGAVDFDPNLGYDYGWFLGKDFRLIGGGTPGFRSELWQYPEQRLNIIMLWNNETINSHHLFWKLRPLLGL